jgi:hypothetical protein
MPELRVAGQVGFVIAWFFLICAGAGNSEAATRTYIGPNNGNWSVAGHWQENAPPVDGDDLHFPAGVVRNSINDIVGLDLRHIRADATLYQRECPDDLGRP